VHAPPGRRWISSGIGSLSGIPQHALVVLDRAAEALDHRLAHTTAASLSERSSAR
jgi:hypothetical protein